MMIVMVMVMTMTMMVMMIEMVIMMVMVIVTMMMMMTLTTLLLVMMTTAKLLRRRFTSTCFTTTWLAEPAWPLSPPSLLGVVPRCSRKNRTKYRKPPNAETMAGRVTGVTTIFPGVLAGACLAATACLLVSSHITKHFQNLSCSSQGTNHPHIQTKTLPGSLCKEHHQRCIIETMSLCRTCNLSVNQKHTGRLHTRTHTHSKTGAVSPRHRPPFRIDRAANLAATRSKSNIHKVSLRLVG